MKMKKMVGALALTAALAMGTTPAFASGTAVGNDQLFSQLGNAADNKAQGNTVVNGMPINAQLIVSVPIDITVVVPTTGGELICPSKTAYRIQNQSNNSVYVIGAQLENGSFKAVADASSEPALDSSSTAGDRAISLIGNGLSFGDKTTGKTAMSNTGTVPWEISAGTSATPTNYEIELSGCTNVFAAQPLTSGSLTSNMCKIVYTITNAKTPSANGADANGAI